LPRLLPKSSRRLKLSQTQISKKVQKCVKFRKCTPKRRKSIRKRSLMLLIEHLTHHRERKLEGLLRWWIPECVQILETPRSSQKTRVVKEKANKRLGKLRDEIHLIKIII
jgi:hypothetical protein